MCLGVRVLGTGFIHPLHACLLVCVTLTYNNSNTDGAHPSSQEVVEKRIISEPRVSHGGKTVSQISRRKSLFEWWEILFAVKIKGRWGSKSSRERVTSLRLHPGSAAASPPSRGCVALHSKVRRTRRNFYSFQNSEQTAVGIPGCSVLFLVIQVQER